MNAAERRPFVSVIIPALNEEVNIARTLESLVRLDFPRAEFEIVLVDNGSSDSTVEIAQSFTSVLNICTVVIPGVNVSFLRNKGAEVSKGDLLAFLDADCTVNKDWITHATRCFLDDSMTALGSPYGVPEDSSWIARTWGLSSKKSLEAGDVERLESANFWIRRRVFFEIGGFDPHLVTNEDHELCFRLRQKGLRIVSDPSVMAIHWGMPRTLRAFYNRERWHGRHVFRVFFMNIKRVPNCAAVAYSMFYALFSLLFFASLPFSIVKGDFRFSLFAFLAMLIAAVAVSSLTLRNIKHSFVNVMQLSLLYFVYGLARASGLFRVNFCKERLNVSSKS